MLGLVRAAKAVSIFIAPIGLAIFAAGQLMIISGIGTDGHPSYTAFAYLIGGWWMKYLCAIGGLAGIFGVLFEHFRLPTTSSTLAKAATAFNIVQVAAVAIATGAV